MTRARRLAFFCALLGSCVASGALAQGSNATQKAAAEAAFQAGVELMARDKPAEACAKFESSQQMDPALGTQIRLADCYETIGKTASAWALFLEVRSAAAVQGRSDREGIAAERAKSLELRLSKLELHVEAKVSGQELKLNGVSIPAATWDAPLPVDPGKQRIEVSAPGYKPWSTEVDVTVGPSSQRVKVPGLVALPPEAKPTLVAPGPAAPVRC
ncbi:MAG: PEGA domain-containing protein [Polyangiaceae bacterium]